MYLLEHLYTDPCQLPAVENGSYKNGYKKGLMITHDSSVEYTCDSGYKKGEGQEISCQLGIIQPGTPTCERMPVEEPTTTTTTRAPKTLPTETKRVDMKSLSSDDAKAQG